MTLPHLNFLEFAVIYNNDQFAFPLVLKVIPASTESIALLMTFDNGFGFSVG
jgi:hypothetical protein